MNPPLEAKSGLWMSVVPGHDRKHPTLSNWRQAQSDGAYPFPGRDGKKIFASGFILRGEMVRYDAPTRELKPWLGGISAEQLSYSPDGKSIVYVSYPEGILWRANRDGTNLIQLTAPPIYPGQSTVVARRLQNSLLQRSISENRKASSCPLWAELLSRFSRMTENRRTIRLVPRRTEDHFCFRGAKRFRACPTDSGPRQPTNRDPSRVAGNVVPTVVG